MAAHEAAGEEAAGAPRVRLIRGDAEIALKCAAGDTTEDCVNAAIVLLDHAAAEKKESAQAKQPQQPSPPPPTLTPPAGGPQPPQSH